MKSLTFLFLLRFGGFHSALASSLRSSRDLQETTTPAPTTTPSPAPTTSFQGQLLNTLQTIVQQNDELKSQNNQLQSEISKISQDIKVLKEASYECFTGTLVQVRQQCGEKCCNGDLACSGWGTNVHTVCTGSCHGAGACRGFGHESVVVRPGSCNGDYACLYLGENTMIEPNACLGPLACNLGPSNGATRILVEEGACHGEQACGSTNQYSSNAPRATDGIRIGASSCVGDFACVDIATEVLELGIGTKSCLGNNACRQFAAYTSSQSSSSLANIGDMACVGENACRDKFSRASQVTGLFNVEDNSCRGDGACYE